MVLLGSRGCRSRLAKVKAVEFLCRMETPLWDVELDSCAKTMRRTSALGFLK